VECILINVGEFRHIYYLLLSCSSWHNPHRSALETTTTTSGDTEMRGIFDGDKGLSCLLSPCAHRKLTLAKPGRISRAATNSSEFLFKFPSSAGTYRLSAHTSLLLNAACGFQHQRMKDESKTGLRIAVGKWFWCTLSHREGEYMPIRLRTITNLDSPSTSCRDMTYTRNDTPTNMRIVLERREI
jgi:hypothetical protein